MTVWIVAICYALGVGFLTGANCMQYAKTHPSERVEFIEHAMPPALRLLVILWSPIIAVIWILFLFFHGTED